MSTTLTTITYCSIGILLTFGTATRATLINVPSNHPDWTPNILDSRTSAASAVTTSSRTWTDPADGTFTLTLTAGSTASNNGTYPGLETIAQFPNWGVGDASIAQGSTLGENLMNNTEFITFSFSRHARLAQFGPDQFTGVEAYTLARNGNVFYSGTGATGNTPLTAVDFGGEMIFSSSDTLEFRVTNGQGGFLGNETMFEFGPHIIPEPGSASLLILGLIITAGAWQRNRRQPPFGGEHE